MRSRRPGATRNPHEKLRPALPSPPQTRLVFGRVITTDGNSRFRRAPLRRTTATLRAPAPVDYNWTAGKSRSPVKSYAHCLGRYRSRARPMCAERVRSFLKGRAPFKRRPENGDFFRTSVVCATPLFSPFKF